MNELKKIVLAGGIVISSWAGTAAAGPFEVSAPSLQRPAVNNPAATDEGGLCICELVNGQWVCVPAGCIGQLSNDGSAIQPISRSVQRRVLPGDQYLRGDQYLPGDQYLRDGSRIPPSPGEIGFSGK